MQQDNQPEAQKKKGTKKKGANLVRPGASRRDQHSLIASRITVDSGGFDSKRRLQDDKERKAKKGT
jgi:hypothetical protein